MQVMVAAYDELFVAMTGDNAALELVLISITIQVNGILKIVIMVLCNVVKVGQLFDQAWKIFLPFMVFIGCPHSFQGRNDFYEVIP